MTRSVWMVMTPMDGFYSYPSCFGWDSFLVQQFGRSLVMVKHHGRKKLNLIHHQIQGIIENKICCNGITKPIHKFGCELFY